MGKRSDFERIDKDFYRTIDPKAGDALRPFLDLSKEYVEPFAGAGDLVSQFPELAWKIIIDIAPKSNHIAKQDAFYYTWYEPNEIILTNPPWTRAIFHHAIEHFTPKVQYCWWLMDANWQFTKQAIPYIKEYVTDIVTIGRLRWIPDTTMSGKDDCVWIRTSTDKSEKFVRFYGRGE